MLTLSAGATQSMVCIGAGLLCIISHVVTQTLFVIKSSCVLL